MLVQNRDLCFYSMVQNIISFLLYIDQKAVSFVQHEEL